MPGATNFMAAPLVVTSCLKGLLLLLVLCSLRASPTSDSREKTADTWIIGVESHLLPISDRSDEGKAIGFAPDLLLEILQRRGIKADFVCKSWPELQADFESGKIDVLAGVAYRSARASRWAFSDPYIEMSAAVIHRKDMILESPISLRGLRVIVAKGSRAEDFLRNRGWDQHPVMVEDSSGAFQMIAQGKADAMIGIRLIAFKRIRDEHLEKVLAIHNDSITSMNLVLHFGVQRGDQYRLKVLNDGLGRLYSDRSYQRLREQWLGPYEVHPRLWSELAPYLIPAFILLGLAIFAFILQRKLTRKLRRSEERLSLVLEGSGDAIWDWDLLRNLLFVSRRWSHLWRDSSLSQTVEFPVLLERVHEEDRERLHHARMRLLTDEGELSVEFRLARDPSVWLHWRGRVITRDGNGGPTRASGICIDISSRKATEILLRENQLFQKRASEILRQAQSVAHMGAWEYEVKTGRLTCSDEIGLLVDSPPGSKAPSPEELLAMILPEYREFARASVERALTQAEGFDIELPFLTHNSRRISLRCICATEHEASTVTRLYGSAQDVTELRAMEENRAELQRKIMETQRFESLGALSGGIAHDFNNLLTVVLSNASLSRFELDEKSPAIPFIAQIELAALNAAEICKQMLAYSGHASTNAGALDIAILVREIRALLDLTLGKRGKLLVELDENAGLIMADRTQMQQLIMSLVQNAAEACSGSSAKVSLRSTRVVLDEQTAEEFRLRYSITPGDYVCIEVSDNGCGMDMATQRHLFEPFFSTKFTGRGLGLAAVHGIVRSHKGAISVISTPGQGTTMKIFLPCTSSPAQEATLPRTQGPAVSIVSASPQKRLTALIADDEETVRDILVHMLTRKGCDSISVENGTKALEQLNGFSDSLDFVMLDLNMPDISGVETLTEIRKKHPCLPVALMTGGDESLTSSLFRDDPYVYRLLKPFTLEALAVFINWASLLSVSHSEKQGGQN
jgi:PAS domain S-box-containing protein